MIHVANNYHIENLINSLTIKIQAILLVEKISFLSTLMVIVAKQPAETTLYPNVLKILAQPLQRNIPLTIVQIECTI